MIMNQKHADSLKERMKQEVAARTQAVSQRQVLITDSTGYNLFKQQILAYMPYGEFTEADRQAELEKISRHIGDTYFIAN